MNKLFALVALLFATSATAQSLEFGPLVTRASSNETYYVGAEASLNVPVPVLPLTVAARGAASVVPSRELDRTLLSGGVEVLGQAYPGVALGGGYQWGDLQGGYGLLTVRYLGTNTNLRVSNDYVSLGFTRNLNF